MLVRGWGGSLSHWGLGGFWGRQPLHLGLQGTGEDGVVVCLQPPEYELLAEEGGARAVISSPREPWAILDMAPVRARGSETSSWTPLSRLWVKCGEATPGHGAPLPCLGRGQGAVVLTAARLPGLTGKREVRAIWMHRWRGTPSPRAQPLGYVSNKVALPGLALCEQDRMASALDTKPSLALAEHTDASLPNGLRLAGFAESTGLARFLG